MAATTSENFLKIGDIVSLKVLKYSAYLSSEGVLVDELGVSSTTLGFVDHLFQVCIQLQYSASNGFEEFVSSYEGDLSNIKDKEIRKHYGALTRGKENEIRMNENFMKQKYGTVVKFGETIQLRHVKSSKFLTVINGELARDERENLCVALTQDGSMDSWLQFLPRFKINKEGDKIPNGSEVLMKVSERMGEYIHCSERVPPPRRLREVNSSVDAQTPWRVTVFTAIHDQLHRNIIESAPKEVKEKDVICGGDIVMIRDPETRSVLMPFNSEKIHCVVPKTSSAPGEDGEVSDLVDESSTGGDSVGKDGHGHGHGHGHGGHGNSNTNGHGNGHGNGNGFGAGHHRRHSHGSNSPSIQSLHSFKDIIEVDDTGEEISPDPDHFSDIDDNDNVSVASAEEYSQEHGDIVLRPMEDDKLDTNCLWVLESKTIVKGGPVMSRTEHVHLRHLNSGLYILRTDSSGCYDRCKLFKFTEKQSDARTLFQLQELAPSKTGQLINSKVAKLRSGHYFIERDNYDDRQRIYSCFGSRNQGKAASLIIQRYQPAIDLLDGNKQQAQDDSAAAKKKAAATPAAAAAGAPAGAAGAVIGAGMIDYRINDGGLRAVPQDVYVGVAARLYMAQFLALTHVPRGKKAASATSVFVSNGTISTDTTADRALFSLIIEKLILFVQGYPINASKSVMAGFVPDKKVVERRQKMFKEQGIIHQLLDMLSRLKPLTKFLSNAPGASSMGLSNHSMAAMSMGTASAFNAMTSPMYAMGKSIVVECLKLLLELIRGNPANQMYIAGHMLIILSHVIVDPLAGTVTKEMLSSNRELQETMIKFKEISIFAEQMRQQEMNSMCLQLLHACCSCQGVGIPRIQLIINQVIYEDFQDVLIQSRIDYGGAGSDDFHASAAENIIPTNDLYLPAGVGAGGRGLMGADILTRGFPSVVLQWVSPSNKYSAAILFGHTEVSMMDVFRPKAIAKANLWAALPKSLAAAASNKGTDSQKEHKQNQIIAEKKRRIADFYSMQLLLAAELCLGRNYRIIEQMETYYPYEMLVAIMRNCCNEDAKAAASRLILCLYVDRDPQLEILLPRLCRTWSEIAATSASGDDSCTVSVNSANSGSNRFKFAIVQMLLADHLKDIIGQPFAAHTTAYLELLHYLVKFSFFSNIDILKDIIDPMVKLLCRDNIPGDVPKVTEVDNAFGSAQNKKKKRKGNDASIVSNRPGGAAGTGDNSLDKVDGTGPSPGHTKSPRVKQSVRGPDDEYDESFEANKKEFGIESTIMKDKLSTGNVMGGVPVLVPYLVNYFNSLRHLILFEVLVFIAIGFAVFFTVVANRNDVLYDDDAHNSHGPSVGASRRPSPMHFYVHLLKAVVLGVFGAETIAKVCVNACSGGKQLLLFLMNPFSIIDLVVLLLMLLAYFTPLLGPFTLFACAPRLLRIIDIVRSSRSTKSMEDLVDSNIMMRFSTYLEPVRYRRTGEASIQAMVEIVSIVATIQRTIQDRNISIFLKGFHDWRANEGKGATMDAVKGVVVPLFQQACDRLEELSVSNSVSDYYYIDLLMYNNHELVQRSLEVLMTHHSAKKFLQQNLVGLQLLVSPKREQQYTKLEVMVTQLRRDVARHDVWGRLQSQDDKTTNAEVLKSLAELTNVLKKRRQVLRFDEPFEADVTLQGILRNIGCFDMCVQMLQLRKTIDPNEAHSPIHRNTRELMLRSNMLLYWFVYDNPTNQQLAMPHLPTFIETIDSHINSHRVITAIFKNNEQLMKYVPKQYIADFAAMICNNGKQVQYLSLLDAVVALDDRSLKENQYEVIRLLSSPQNIKKVVQYFVPLNHPKYAEKCKLMSAYLDKGDVEVEDLPPDLAYHLQLIQLLSKCTVGVAGMTSIEAKVQSMFNFVDVFQALLDPQTLLLAKIRLGQFIYNAFIEVEMKLPSLAEADVTWKLIESTNETFIFARDWIRFIEKNGWEHKESNRQRIEYMITCAMMVGGFFERYYHPEIFRPDAGSTPGIERVTIKEPRAIEIIRGLFANIKNVYEMRSPLLSKAHGRILYRTLCALNQATPTFIVATVDDLHTEEAEPMPDEDGDDSHTAQARQYATFTAVLADDPDILAATEEELAHFIEIIENLPRKADAGDPGAVRFEALLEHLVAHARSCIEVVIHGAESTKHVPDKKSETCIWMIRIFRLMIERKWGMTIFERDDDGGEEQDVAAGEVMSVLTAVGAPGMCLDFIARGIDPVLQAEAIKLLVALLFREGGALDVQKAIYAHLNRPGSDLFFLHIRSMIQDLMQWHKVRGMVGVEENEEPNLPAEIILIRFLQLTCEGHFKPNQDIVRNQPLNQHKVNLLDDLVQYLQTLALYPRRTSTVASLSVIATILEVIQGPCEGNQDHFAFNTELIEVLNRRMRSRLCLGCLAEEENELKKAAIEVFQALLEGQGQKKDIYERMLSVIHLDVIKMICENDNGEDEEEEEGDGKQGEEGAEKEQGNENSAVIATEVKGAEEAGGEDGGDDGLEDLQIECLVLMQMLVDFKPQIFKDMKLESLYAGRTDIACVEVFWRGQLQRRFFHVPDICADLAKSSKDEFILTADRSSPENKLLALLDVSKVLHSEILHQQRLKEWGIARIFSRANQERSKQLSFMLALLVNGLYLGFYSTTWCPKDQQPGGFLGDDDFNGNPRHHKFMPCTDSSLPEAVSIAILVLNVLLLITSGFTLLLSLVVRVPVNLEMMMYRGKSQLQALLYSAMDIQTLYYVAYFAVVFVSIFNQLLSPFLLLDIIMLSPVLQEVLQAAWKPRMSILMSIVLTWIICYLYALMVFYQFSYSDINANVNNFVTMWDVFAEYVRYGSFAGSIWNYGDINVSTTSTHYIVDVLFFVTVFVMWNIVKGITFDQFVEIRSKLLARVKDTEEICFMCGITDKIFNRTIGRDTFKKHIKNEQNLWNYVYYIIAIWEQDKDDDDGLEWQIRRYIAAKDLTWFPMNKAVCLMMQEDVDDELDEYLRTSLKHVERDFDEKIAAFKESLLKSMTRVEGALSFQPEADNRSLKSKSASLASMVGRKHTADVHEAPRRGSANRAVTTAEEEAIASLMKVESLDDSANLMLGGGLERSVDDASIGEVTEASFSDSYSVVVVVEQVLNLMVPRSSVDALVCRVDCDVSTHNLHVHQVAEVTDENDDAGVNGGGFLSRIPTLGCYSVTFGKSHVAVDTTVSRGEQELMEAEVAQSNKRVVFHGKLGDNIDNSVMSMVLFTEQTSKAMAPPASDVSGHGTSSANANTNTSTNALYDTTTLTANPQSDSTPALQSHLHLPHSHLHHSPAHSHSHSHQHLPHTHSHPHIHPSGFTPAKLIASVEVPIAVLLDAAEAKCKIDILLQQSHGLPVPNAVAILSVEVIGGEFAQLGLQ